MKRMIKALLIIVSLALPALSGCRLIIHPALVASDELTNVTTFDPNDYGFTIDYQKIESDNGDSGNYVLQFEGDNLFQIHQRHPVKVKYAPFSKSPVCQCRIGKKSYTVLFDTGNSVLPHITTAHIMENNLPVYSVAVTPTGSHQWNFGIALIDELKIGKLTITQLPASYNFLHTGYQLFGLDFAEVAQDKQINIPLTVMQQFKYITFDNIKKRMRFSLDDSFDPDDRDDWKCYPLTITDDNRISINSTLEGIPVTLIIDTGCEADLVLTQDCFNRLIENHPKLAKSWKLETSAFAPLAGGYFSMQHRLIWGLTFDQYKYRLSTSLGVIDKDVLFDFLNDHRFDGIIGFPFFKDTVMVLDFERQKIWVKKTKRSRFFEEGR